MAGELALLAALFLVALVPGPLAIVAFYGGTQGLRTFVSGLAGQVCALLITTNAIVITGASLNVTQSSWFTPLAALALLALGLSILRSKGGQRPPDALAFASTFLMAAGNPKAIFGFGPPLLAFHGETLSVARIITSSILLIIAVSISMAAYFALGKMTQQRSVVQAIRFFAGTGLVLFAALLMASYFDFLPELRFQSN